MTKFRWFAFVPIKMYSNCVQSRTHKQLVPHIQQSCADLRKKNCCLSHWFQTERKNVWTLCMQRKNFFFGYSTNQQVINLDNKWLLLYVPMYWTNKNPFLFKFILSVCLHFFFLVQLGTFLVKGGATKFEHDPKTGDQEHFEMNIFEQF